MPSIAALAGLPVISSGGTAPTLSAASLWGPRTQHSMGAAPLSLSATGQAPILATSSLGSGESPRLTNLLPFAPPRLSPPTLGVYVGEGLPPVPPKLAERIKRWEYIEMSELLPEFWSKPDDMDNKQAAARRRRQVTEIFTWVQCFATYTSVLSGSYPETVPELLAYLVTITRVSQDFAGLAWVRYDASFRRQAAITGNRKWSQVNPSLYSICFTGRAQHANRCELCFSATHVTKECALGAEADPELPTRVKAVEAALVSLASQRQNDKATAGPSASQQICRLWNANRCRFQRCRYRHVCSGCGEAHPLASCPKGVETRPPMRGAIRKDLSRPY